MSVSTLYLCYFGLREPLVQTQVLPYLRQLASAGVSVGLLTFEPEMARAWDAGALAAERGRLAGEGIEWSALPYHKRPSALATAWDVLAGAWAAARAVRRGRADVLHARAHVPLAMALLARLLAPRCRVVFDVRGLMAEEYADAGVWAEGSLMFRAVKRLERAGLRGADQVVVLTERMREWVVREGLAAAEKVTVIPCCVGLARFGAAGGGAGEDDGAAASAGAGRFEVVYAGAVTGLYLLEEMAGFFKALRARRPEAFFRVLTRAPAERVAATLAGAGLSPEDFKVEAADPAEVPAHLARARLGLSFRKPTFSQIAASPTKIPEYLAAGLPVVSNAGIGDTDELLERERVGVVVRGFSSADYEEAAGRALALAEDPSARARCPEVAGRFFDLAAVGGARYCEVYRRLGASLPAAPAAAKPEARGTF
ncbi:MAG TPA: glycosyltransferase [Pyrinomonadaceae bacterium]|jgi:glycosyltransferase involved in cell wall biosynthesis